MEYEPAFQRIRNDIYRVLDDLVWPSTQAAREGVRAQRDLAFAFERASGRPQHALWQTAMASLERFIDVCEHSHRLDRASALDGLRRFVQENTDALGSAELARAS